MHTDAAAGAFAGCNAECIQHNISGDWNSGANFGGSAASAEAHGWNGGADTFHTQITLCNGPCADT